MAASGERGGGARWFVRGDIDGFFGLAVDNLIQLLVIAALLDGVIGLDRSFVIGRVLPGAALSILVGNVFYSFQAKRLADRTGRSDVTALPYGINTVSLFAYVFLVMLPVKLAALAAGFSAGDAALAAWRAGLVACFAAAVIEIVGAFAAPWMRRNTPRAALLSALAGVAVSFIAIGFLFKTFAAPLVGLTTLSVILVCYFADVRFVGGMPGGLVAVILGVALAWATGLSEQDAAVWASARASIGFAPPTSSLGDLGAALRGDVVATYLSVIVPMGVVNVIGSMQNIESAEAAGDSYPTASSLLANGVGSIVAAAFGSCFPTTIYIGHPGWKALGARIGYSVLNGAFVTIVCVSGALAWISLAVPIEAGMAIVLWIGIVIVAQAFSATPPSHAPAVAVGLLPGIAAWGALMLKQGLRAGGYGGGEGPAFGASLEGVLAGLDIAARGLFALEQGFLFTAMILAAMTSEIIERRFRHAAAWSLVAAALAWCGLIHAYVYTPGDTAVALGFGTGASWSVAYVACAAFLLIAPYVTRPSGGAH
jgi:AGZA family xanthine/uracil permease-like MFS transporter